MIKPLLSVLYNEPSSCFLAVLQSVDYVHPDGNVVFRTCSKETDKLVFQMVIFFFLKLFKGISKVLLNMIIIFVLGNI